MNELGDSDMISLISGNGGTQVDLVFYIFTQSMFHFFLNLISLALLTVS